MIGFSLSDNVISPDEKSSGFPLMQEDRIQTQLRTLRAVHNMPPFYTFLNLSPPLEMCVNPIRVLFPSLLLYMYSLSLE